MKTIIDVSEKHCLYVRPKNTKEEPWQTICSNEDDNCMGTTRCNPFECTLQNRKVIKYSEKLLKALRGNKPVKHWPMPFCRSKELVFRISFPLILSAEFQNMTIIYSTYSTTTLCPANFIVCLCTERKWKNRDGIISYPIIHSAASRSALKGCGECDDLTALFSSFFWNRALLPENESY